MSATIQNHSNLISRDMAANIASQQTQSNQTQYIDRSNNQLMNGTGYMTAGNFSNPMTPPKLKSQQNSNNAQLRDIIIHRTSNSVFVNDNQDYLKRKEEREKNIRDKGWNAPTDRPYQQFGDFANVLQAIEGIKMNLPHTRGSLDLQTHKNIKIMKRINEKGSSYSTSSNFAQQLVDPGRTVKILNQYQGQLKKLRAASQISPLSTSNQILSQYPSSSDQQPGLFNKKRFSNQDNTKNNHVLSGGEDDEDGQEDILKEQHYIRLKNTRLNTSSLKRLINQSNDGGSVLKSEIAQSYQRVKAVKHGMLIKQLMQQTYQNQNSQNQKSNIKKRKDSTDNSEGNGFKLQPIFENDSNTFLTSVKEKPIASNMKNYLNSSAVSKTQPTSPNKNTRFGSTKRGSHNLNRTQFGSSAYIDIKNISQREEQVQQSFQFQPEQIIFIPNYQNKKAKIIRVNDLAKLQGGYGGRTNKGIDGTILGNNRNNETKVQGFQDLIGNVGQNNYNSNTALSQMSFKKQNQNVNYHRKLQDEFDRYEQVFKEHFVTSNKDLMQQSMLNNQETPRNGHLINSLISNQFLSKQPNPFTHGTNSYLTAQSTNMQGVNTNRGLSRDESYQSDNQTPFLKAQNRAKQKKSSMLIKNESQTPVLGQAAKTNVKPNPQITLKRTNVSTNQGSTLSYYNQNSNQKGQPKSFDAKLTKQEREQILISAITNSIKYQNEQDEQKLLDMLNEDQLFKECSQLLKDYFQINFLNEIKDNKVLVFRLYKLYLLHSLSLNFKQIDDNQNQANNVQYFKKHHRTNQNGQLEEVISIASDSSDEDQNYRGESGTGAFKQKMNGFIRLLQEILSPAEKESLELDSVFQLKQLVKSYYEKKGLIAENLTETLYAMMCERPQILDAKKKNFFTSYEEFDTYGIEVKKIRNLYFELEQMRLKAEKERITNYREMIESILSQTQMMSPTKKQSN